jgi:Zn-dependent protease
VGDLTLQHVVLRVFAVLLILAVHGWTLAATGCRLGDAGPRHDGRLSANPIRHLDILGGLLAILFTFGWMRPMALDRDRLHRGGLVLSVVAASCATLGVGLVLHLLRPMLLNWLPDTAAPTFFVLVDTIEQLALSFTLFNLLPLPPLTGAHLLAAVVPGNADLTRRLTPYGTVLLALLIASGTIERLFAPIGAAVREIVAIG